MSVRRLAISFVLCFCWLTFARKVNAQGVAIIPGIARLTVQVDSMQQFRQARVVRQKWDMSCGSAALSTLMTYYLHDPTPETAIIVWILHRTSPVKIQSRGGFSLFDLKRYAEAHGYKAEGYGGLKLKDLKDMGRPAIVPVRVKGYNHFVLFLNSVGKHVLVADPSFGNLTMTADRFQHIWKSGIAFYVFPEGSKLTKKPTSPQFADYRVPDAGAVYRDALDHPAILPRR